MKQPWIKVAVALSIVMLSACSTSAQYFDSKMGDQEYLDRIQEEVVNEVKETKAELMDQAKVIQQVTRTYIAAKLKQNLFKALRVLAERELAIDAMTMQDRPRQPRQEEEETESGASGGGAAGGAEEETESATRRPSQILPQVANLIKAVFGGNINLTSYVEAAATFLPKPVGNQLVGVVKLLANNPGHKYTTTTTLGTTPSTTTVEVRSSPKSRRTRTTTVATSTTTPVPQPPQTTGQIEDEDEDNDDSGDSKAVRQLNIPGLDIIGNLGNSIGNLLNSNNRNNNNNNNANNNNVQSQNGTTDPFQEGNQNGGNSNNNSGSMNGIDVSTLAKEVRNGLGDLIKVMPDLFRGAREAFSLLTAVTRLFSSFGN